MPLVASKIGPIHRSVFPDRLELIQEIGDLRRLPGNDILFIQMWFEAREQLLKLLLIAQASVTQRKLEWCDWIGERQVSPKTCELLPLANGACELSL